MHFLNACTAVGRDADLDILLTEQAGQFPTVVTGKCDNRHVTRHGGFDRFHNITAIAAGGNCQQYVAGVSERTNLFGLDFIVQAIVGNRS